MMEKANEGSPTIDQIAHLIEPTTVNLMSEEVAVDTHLKKSRFKKEGRYLIATMRSGFECRVVLDSEFHLEQCNQLCPLTDWMEEEEMFGDSHVGASKDASIFKLQVKDVAVEKATTLPQWSSFEEDNNLME